MTVVCFIVMSLLCKHVRLTCVLNKLMMMMMMMSCYRRIHQLWPSRISFECKGVRCPPIFSLSNL